MTEPSEEPIIEHEQQDDELGRILSEQRPVPSAGFRGALARWLLANDPGYGPRPERLRAMVAGYLSGGFVLIVLGTLQATGHL